MSQGPEGAPNYSGFGASTVVPSNPHEADFTANGHAVGDDYIVSIGGWMAVNGGINKYVYSVNGGEWIDAVGGVDGEPLPNYFKDLGMADGSTKNGMFNGGNMLKANLEAYAGQNVTVTFAAVAESNGAIVTITVLNNVAVPAKADEPHEHSYEAVVTAPTCTEAGYTTYTCACGDSYVDDETAATGHSFVMGVCTVCGAEDPDFVPAYRNETIVLGERAGGGPFSGEKTFGQRYNIGDNVLKAVTVGEMATYGDGGVNTWSFKIWQWNTDYATTVAAEPLFVKLGENHPDNSHFTVLVEGANISGDFYYEIEYLSGSQRFTGWAANGKVVDGLESYVAGNLQGGNYASSIIVGVPYDPNAPIEDPTVKFESNVDANAEGTDIMSSQGHRWSVPVWRHQRDVC